jgi:hypothetical protein
MQTSPDPRLRILILSGSQRRQKNCPKSNSKSRAMMLRMAERLPKDFTVEYEDLGNVTHEATIQPCNACVSTSMALCVWPCNCYLKNDLRKPDLMWNLDLYRRLELADAWAIIGPVNWYGPSSNLKLMFDRLVCMNGGNPRDDLIDNKDAEKAMKLERSDRFAELSKNHLEGRTAAFFCHGDEGGDEIDDTGRPKILRHKEYFIPERDELKDDRLAYMSLVSQCRYSGIEVPDYLWRYATNGKDVPYADNQVEDIRPSFWAQFDQWTDDFAGFVKAKGKAPTPEYSLLQYDQVEHMA